MLLPEVYPDSSGPSANTWPRPTSRVEQSRQERPLDLLYSFSSAPPGAWRPLVVDEDRRCYSFLWPRAISSDLSRQFQDRLVATAPWVELKNTKGTSVTRSTCWYARGGCSCDYTYGKDTRVENSKNSNWKEQESDDATRSSAGSRDTGKQGDPSRSAPSSPETPNKEFRAVMHEITSHVFGGLFPGLAEAAWPNSANVNLYADGRQAVGWHADDESLFKGKDSDCPIVSVSLGTSREFWMALKRGDGMDPDLRTITEADLGDGDMVTMEGRMQHHTVHMITKGNPREPIRDARINITFRWVREHRYACGLYRRRKQNMPASLRGLLGEVRPRHPGQADGEDRGPPRAPMHLGPPYVRCWSQEVLPGVLADPARMEMRLCDGCKHVCNPGHHDDDEGRLCCEGRDGYESQWFCRKCWGKWEPDSVPELPPLGPLAQDAATFYDGTCSSTCSPVACSGQNLCWDSGGVNGWWPPGSEIAEGIMPWFSAETLVAQAGMMQQMSALCAMAAWEARGMPPAEVGLPNGATTAHCEATVGAEILATDLSPGRKRIPLSSSAEAFVTARTAEANAVPEGISSHENDESALEAKAVACANTVLETEGIESPWKPLERPLVAPQVKVVPPPPTEAPVGGPPRLVEDEDMQQWTSEAGCPLLSMDVPPPPARPPPPKPPPDCAPPLADCDSLSPSKEHMLSCNWYLWLLMDRAGTSWEEAQQQVHGPVSSVEMFWQLLRHIHPASALFDSDYSFFREGTSPAREDPCFEKGGRWILAVVCSPGRPEAKGHVDEACFARLVDQAWSRLLLEVIGPGFEDAHASECIGGVVVSLRERVPQASSTAESTGVAPGASARSTSAKLALWLRDASDREQVQAIGQVFRNVLDLALTEESEIPRGGWKLAFEDFQTRRVMFRI